MDSMHKDENARRTEKDTSKFPNLAASNSGTLSRSLPSSACSILRGLKRLWSPRGSERCSPRKPSWLQEVCLPSITVFDRTLPLSKSVTSLSFSECRIKSRISCQQYEDILTARAVSSSRRQQIFKNDTNYIADKKAHKQTRPRATWSKAFSSAPVSSPSSPSSAPN